MVNRMFFTAALLLSIGYATEIGDLVSTMQPGTWAELPTNNIASVIQADGAMRCILPYADGGAWDPNGESFYFIGSDHQHSTGYAKFAHYSVETNSWRELPRPPFFRALTSNAMHGYDHTAINVSAGRLYHIPYGYGSTRSVYQYTISTGTWNAIPSITGSLSCCVGMEYFPEAGGLVVNSAQFKTVLFYHETTRLWQRMTTALPTNAGYQSIAEYNPVHKLMVIGGGAGSRDMFKLDADLNITQMKDAPCDIEVHNGCVFTLDPVSGDYLVVANTKAFYAYDITTDTWTRLPGTPPLWSDGSLWETKPVTCIVATPVSNYGVTMFVRAYRYKSAFKVYLYKHSRTQAVTGDRTAFLSNIGLSARPNPFKTSIKIAVSGERISDSNIGIALYNIKGNKVHALSATSYQLSAGISWNASDQPPGIYIVQVKSGNKHFQKRIVLSK
jgi:hypothetical protein